MSCGTTSCGCGELLVVVLWLLWDNGGGSVEGVSIAVVVLVVVLRPALVLRIKLGSLLAILEVLVAVGGIV